MKATSAGDKLWHIKQCPLFSAMSAEEMHAIGSAAQMYEVAKNKVIPPPPEDEPSLFVVGAAAWLSQRRAGCS